MGKKPIYALALGLGALWASGALAADDASKAGADPSKKICRSLVPTGTRMAVRKCMTKAEWDRSQDRQQEGVLKYQTDNQTQYQQAGGPM